VLALDMLSHAAVIEQVPVVVRLLAVVAAHSGGSLREHNGALSRLDGRLPRDADPVSRRAAGRREQTLATQRAAPVPRHAVTTRVTIAAVTMIAMTAVRGVFGSFGLPIVPTIAKHE
jgi:hypothetical protein